MIEEFFGSDAYVIKKQRIFGGDANDAFLLYLNDGRKIFLKENSIDNADFFRAEAEGVTAIKDTKAVRVPEILGSGADENSSYLLMEYIESSNTSKGYWEKLGTALANMHKADTEKYVNGKGYGFYSDNYIGAGKQKNTIKSGWIKFFSECRLRPQFELAERYFDERDIRNINYLLDHLDKYLYEPEKPSLLHGDLWSGNILSDEKGDPVLIDPAVYVGCSEADIAMTELFGGFREAFYRSYFEEMGSVPGYEDRRDLYNLYHLTNHLNLFGRSYLGSVKRIVSNF